MIRGNLSACTPRSRANDKHPLLHPFRFLSAPCPAAAQARAAARARQGDRPPMTDESIRRAVAEFKAESADFASPRAEAKWGRIADWDVSGVRSMRNMFAGAGIEGDLSLWEVGACVDMDGMFDHAAAFNADLSAWLVGACKNMNSMFQYAEAFDADLSAWPVGAGTDMRAMFHGATAFDRERHAPWLERR